MKQLLLILAVALSCATAADAQTAPGLSLADARLAARRVSPELRSARDAVAAAEARARQAGVFLNPRFVYSREQTSGGGLSNSQDIFLLEQPLEVGGARGARRDAADLRRAAAEAHLAEAEARLDFDVTRAWALAVATERQAALAEGAMASFTQAVRVSEQRLNAGDISGYANRRMRLEAARYAMLRAEVLLARRSARYALAVLIAPSGDSLPALRLVLSETAVLALPTPTADSLLAHALRARPEILAATLDAQAGQADARVARSERLPIPVLSLGHKGEDVSGSTQRLNGFAAGLTIPLPLWDRRAGAVDAATADARRREAEVEMLRRRVTREVAEARDAYLAAREQVDILAPQLGAEALTALRAAELAYAEGDIPLVEWLDAVRAYREAESAFAVLRAEVLIRRAALERAAGLPLFPTTPLTGGSAAPANDDRSDP